MFVCFADRINKIRLLLLYFLATPPLDEKFSLWWGGCESTIKLGGAFPDAIYLRWVEIWHKELTLIYFKQPIKIQ